MLEGTNPWQTFENYDSYHSAIQKYRKHSFDPVADAWESLSEGDTLEKENALLREQLSELLEYRVTTEGAVEELLHFAPNWILKI